MQARRFGFLRTLNIVQHSIGCNKEEMREEKKKAASHAKAMLKRFANAIIAFMDFKMSIIWLTLSQ